MKRLLIGLAVIAISLLISTTALAQVNGTSDVAPPERTDNDLVGLSLYIARDNGLEVSVEGSSLTFTDQKGQNSLPAVQLPEVEAVTPSD